MYTKPWSLVLRTMDTTQRASMWSVTINNPTKEEVEGTLPPGWSMEGQYEKGDQEGTLHFQGLLKTTQVRFSAVKRQFPRAHIEVARNAEALRAYVHKEETRVGEFTPVRTPNIFEVQTSVCKLWVKKEYEAIRDTLADLNKKDAVLLYVDRIVDRMIMSGIRGIEFISINPMWRSSWSRHAHSILHRHGLPPPLETDRQTDGVDRRDPGIEAAIEAANMCDDQDYRDRNGGEPRVTEQDLKDEGLYEKK